MKSAGELMPERSIDMVEAKYLCLISFFFFYASTTTIGEGFFEILALTNDPGPYGPGSLIILKNIS